MHDIEHEYDQLFHMIESKTHHGVEHRDIIYKTLPFDGFEDDEDEQNGEAETNGEEVTDDAAEENETYSEHYHPSDAPVLYEDHRLGSPHGTLLSDHHSEVVYAHSEPVYHVPIYHDPVIHGDRGQSEYHELDSEPFIGDYKHGGGLHFAPFTHKQEE